MADWTEKYRPTTLSAVRGNDSARDDLREWAETWPEHGEAVVLHGSPGVGKTSAAHALAADSGWGTVELNASDKRTAAVVERFAGRAARNATLDGAADESGGGGRQLVILDEADNVHGNYDRGGSRAISDLVREAEQPVVLIANDYYDLSRGLRDACREIEFRDVGARSIVPVLRDICRREGIEFEEAALERLAEADAGDLRGAIRDLQAVAGGSDHLRVEDVVTAERDRSLGVFDFLDAVLKEESAETALESAYAADETPDDLVRWVEENLPKVYEGEELLGAYEFLANADRWLGRVRATQEYGYWRYATDNLAAGVAAARDGGKGGWTRYARPQFWPGSDETADAVARAVAVAHGTSMATARLAVLPLLGTLIHHCKPRDLTVAVAAHYGFDEAELAHVTGSGASTNKVESIVEEAADRREAALADHAGDAFAPATSSATDDAGGAADGSGERDDAGDGAEGGTADTDDADAGESDPDDAQSGLGDFV